MADKLQRIFEYRVLLSRAREHQIPLTEQEQARLSRLEHQLGSGVPSVDDRDPFTMLPRPQRADYVHAGRFGVGEIRNATRDGLAITTDEPPPLGQRVIVHVGDAERPIEYTFPARVIVRVLRGEPAMGLAFDGMPTQNRAGARQSGVFRADETPLVNPVPEKKRGA
ncbi:MAG: hypothetical protein PVI30_01980 [Myxococcales bacterium]|jgi:hypothetical protein